ncbi:MAG: SCP2 sterol-binding domain-containing protein [Betaproteobacteria bacterium]|nr:SCP2 sterol-binding domain-containing protein [Betaproteobacteria bacterium]
MRQKLPPFTFPAPVAAVVSRLPMWPAAWALSRALDFGAGRIVPRDALGPLVGRRFALCARDLGLTVHFESTPSGFRPAAPPFAPDLSITATVRDFIALGLREEDPDTLFFARRLQVEGDTDLGLTVKNLLDGIDWGAVAEALLAQLPAALRRFVPGR